MANERLVEQIEASVLIFRPCLLGFQKFRFELGSPRSKATRVSRWSAHGVFRSVRHSPALRTACVTVLRSPTAF